MVIDNKQYLPPPSNTLKGKLVEFKAWSAYRHWKHRLSKLIKQQNPTILECGCGPGFLSKFIKRWFISAHVYLSDYEYTLIQRAKHELNSNNLFQADAEKLPVQSDSIDILISFHMIEHLENPEMFLKNALRVLKPGGHLIYATPNPDGIPARFMKEKWSGIRPDHISLLSPQEWKEITVSSGFELVEHGTTTLSGIPIFKKFPFNIINHGSLFVFGFFPWMKGEAYIGIYQKPFVSDTLTNFLLKDNPNSDSLEFLNSLSQATQAIVCCPQSHQKLQEANEEQITKLNKKIEAGQLYNISNAKVKRPIQAALIRFDRKLCYPIKDGIPILLPEESIYLAE
jgi:ubiquinone/menaquinone biosynthesis C-methylase UbiE/uncharacterized protein YbaR (Trm112 family)